MSTIFEKYEIPMETTLHSLVCAIFIYETLVESLTAETVSTADYESTVRSEWTKNDESETYRTTVETIRSLVWNLLDSEPRSSVNLFEELGNLRSEVKDERDYQVRMFARLNRPKVAVGSEFLSNKSDAEKVKEYVFNVYNVLNQFGVEIPNTVKVKTQKDGTVKPDISRLPSGPREGSAGRKSATHNLRLVVDGTKFDLPIERVLHDVVSEGSIRVSVSDLISTVGETFSKGWSDPVTLNGKNIVGVIESADSDDADDENDDDEDENED